MTSSIQIIGQLCGWHQNSLHLNIVRMIKLLFYVGTEDFGKTYTSKTRRTIKFQRAGFSLVMLDEP